MIFRLILNYMKFFKNYVAFGIRLSYWYRSVIFRNKIFEIYFETLARFEVHENGIFENCNDYPENCFEFSGCDIQ